MVSEMSSIASDGDRERKLLFEVGTIYVFSCVVSEMSSIASYRDRELKLFF